MSVFEIRIMVYSWCGFEMRRILSEISPNACPEPEAKKTLLDGANRAFILKHIIKIRDGK
jgi:hypothetical protein